MALDSPAPEPRPHGSTRQRRYSALLRWHESGTSTAEKNLVFKLDLVILLYTCLSFFIKYLEQTSVTNAYYSGLENDFQLARTDVLNWLSTYYGIGIIIGAPLATPVLTAISPAYWLPGCTAVSSLFVLFMYKATTVEQLYALRFCTGLASSTIMPGAFYLIGSWYRRSEIYRRSAIFYASSFGGTMFSGYIQAGLVGSMDGRLGIRAWRWLFIFNAILGIPIAVFGVLCCPTPLWTKTDRFLDEPHAKRPWWMNEDEQTLAIERLRVEGRDCNCDCRRPSFLSTLKRLFTSWQLYIFPIAAGMREFTCGTELYRWMGLYLKSLPQFAHNTTQINAIPTSVPCLEILSCVLISHLIDWSQLPHIIVFLCGLLQIYGYSVLIVWPSQGNIAWVLSSYLVAATGYSAIGPVLNAWANSSCGGDRELRAVTTAFITMLGYVAETVGQQVFFPVSQAPRFEGMKGYAWGVSWAVATVLFVALVIPAAVRIWGVRVALGEDARETRESVNERGKGDTTQR